MTENAFETNQPFPVLAFANMNLTEGEIRKNGIAAYGDILAELEGSAPGQLFPGGISITPTKAIVRDVEQERIVEAGVSVAELHQTWPKGVMAGFREECSLLGLAINTAAVMFMMPERERSVSVLKDMDAQLGGHTPLTVYGDIKDRHGRLTDLGGLDPFTGTQLSPNLLIATGGLNADGTLNYRATHDSLQARGIKRVVVDCHHLNCGADQDETRGLNPDEVLTAVETTGTYIAGLHIAVGRVDAKHAADRYRSREELKALLEGAEAFGQTQAGRILRRAYNIACAQRQTDSLPLARRIEYGNAVQIESENLDLQQSRAVYRPWSDASRAIANDPTVRQYREELALRAVFNGHAANQVAATLEIPYRGLVSVRSGRRVSRADFVSMTRDAAQSATEFLAA